MLSHEKIKWKVEVRVEVRGATQIQLCWFCFFHGVFPFVKVMTEQEHNNGEGAEQTDQVIYTTQLLLFFAIYCYLLHI